MTRRLAFPFPAPTRPEERDGRFERSNSGSNCLLFFLQTTRTVAAIAMQNAPIGSRKLVALLTLQLVFSVLALVVPASSS